MNQNITLKKLKEKENKLMKKYGFIIHSVFPTDDEEVLWNHHTHGLKENFNHKDFQIVLPIAPEIVGEVFHGMVYSIKEGENFENISISDKVIENYNVQLVNVKEGDRELIRIILPDVQGRFPRDKDCDDIYKNQLDDLIQNNSNTLN